MRVVLVTIQRDRRAHLRRQLTAAQLSERRADAHVVVSMDPIPPRLPGCDVLHLPIADGEPLPLAQARNLAIRRALRTHRADLVVALDVDCLPAPGLIGRYERAAKRRPRALLSGPVRYLQPGAPDDGPLPSAAELQAAPPHPARPVPADGVLQPEPRYELFWSLSFALTPPVFHELGGFDERYVGYGAEDTDVAMRAQRAGVELVWVGGAEAYHQHHPVSSPPVEHLDDIVRNASVFRELWGTWPMEGWLQAFADCGLVDWQDDRLVLRQPV